MLVDADPVEAKLIGIFKLIEITVIELVALFGIVVAVGKFNPGSVLDGVEVDRGIRHQMEK
jgi:hypothetical protein